MQQPAPAQAGPEQQPAPLPEAASKSVASPETSVSASFLQQPLALDDNTAVCRTANITEADFYFHVMRKAFMVAAEPLSRSLKTLLSSALGAASPPISWQKFARASVSQAMHVQVDKDVWDVYLIATVLRRCLWHRDGDRVRRALHEDEPDWEKTSFFSDVNAILVTRNFWAHDTRAVSEAEVRGSLDALTRVAARVCDSVGQDKAFLSDIEELYQQAASALLPASLRLSASDYCYVILGRGLGTFAMLVGGLVRTCRQQQIDMEHVMPKGDGARPCYQCGQHMSRCLGRKVGKDRDESESERAARRQELENHLKGDGVNGSVGCKSCKTQLIECGMHDIETLNAHLRSCTVSGCSPRDAAIKSQLGMIREARHAMFHGNELSDADLFETLASIDKVFCVRLLSPQT